MKKPFTMNYKTYQGEPGNPRQWRSAFRERMNKEEAEELLQEDSPEAILGLSGIYTFRYLQETFRELIKIHHPDRGGDTIKAQKIIAAYTILKERFGE